MKRKGDTSNAIQHMNYIAHRFCRHQTLLTTMACYFWTGTNSTVVALDLSVVRSFAYLTS